MDVREYRIYVYQYMAGEWGNESAYTEPSHAYLV